MSSKLESLANIRIVLCQTSHPGNIGSAARAMKTMGLTQLVLVRPKKFPHDIAEAMASGANDILAEARVCDSLEEAIAFAKDLAEANPGAGGYEIRPVGIFHPSELG